MTNIFSVLLSAAAMGGVRGFFLVLLVILRFFAVLAFCVIIPAWLFLDYIQRDGLVLLGIFSVATILAVVDLLRVMRKIEANLQKTKASKNEQSEKLNE